jgi:hypothetical protein
MNTCREINDLIVDEIKKLMGKNYNYMDKLDASDILKKYAGIDLHVVKYEKRYYQDKSISFSLIHEDHSPVYLPEFLKNSKIEHKCSMFKYGFRIYPDGKVESDIDDDYDD